MRPVFRPMALAIACLISTSAQAAVDGFDPKEFKANHGLGHAALTKAKSVKPVKVLASLPITYGLAEVLLKDTDVQLERAAPANLPGSRQVSYFTGRGAAALNTLAQDADAAIGLRSLWADDPLYPWHGAAISASLKWTLHARWTVACRALRYNRVSPMASTANPGNRATIWAVWPMYWPPT